MYVVECLVCPKEIVTIKLAMDEESKTRPMLDFFGHASEHPERADTDPSMGDPRANLLDDFNSTVDRPPKDTGSRGVGPGVLLDSPIQTRGIWEAISLDSLGGYLPILLAGLQYWV